MSLDPEETALVLTQQEWDDLSVVADVYVRRTAWGHPTEVQRRRLELCRRIIEANQP